MDRAEEIARGVNEAYWRSAPMEDAEVLLTGLVTEALRAYRDDGLEEAARNTALSMTHTDDGGPAFPHDTTKLQFGTEGMSLRAYLAGRAMQGILASGYYDSVAMKAINFADALISALSELPSSPPPTPADR